jgi:hypothetical protein
MLLKFTQMIYDKLAGKVSIGPWPVKPGRRRKNDFLPPFALAPASPPHPVKSKAPPGPGAGGAWR